VLWAPTQYPGPGAKLVATTLGIVESAVTVNMTRVGGRLRQAAAQRLHG